MITLRMLLLAILAFGTACNQDRLARLEKENKELRVELAKQKQFTDLDVQGKCADAAKKYFREEFSSDKSTILLDHYNHYNRELGKCFALIEWHYYDTNSKTGSWHNMIKIVDVYERDEYADFSDYTEVAFSPTPSSKNSVLTCEVDDKKCSSMEEFHRLSAHFMAN